MADLTKVTPVARAAGGHAAEAVHKHLRNLILKGDLAPGAVLSQVDLAPRLGVSRTPLREAIRQLQEEGLVKAEPQRRARVVEFDPDELDAIYAERIALESLAVLLTVPNVEAAELRNLNERLQAVAAAAEREDLEGWHEAHRDFHLALVADAGPALLREITVLIDRGERYRGLYQASSPRTWSIGNAEHVAIVGHFAAGRAELAARDLASHLARTALSLIANLAPEHEPRAMRAALKLVQAASAQTTGGHEGRRRAQSSSS